MHGDIAQNTREKVMQRFRDGKFSVLVATDVAARGLDVPDVDLVIHSTLPQDIESFTHRSGRTGRAGKSGTTIAMFSPRERQYFHRIMKAVKVRVLVGPPSLEPPLPCCIALVRSSSPGWPSCDSHS